MDKLGDAAEFAWNYPRQRMAEAIIHLAASFGEPHDVWGQEVDEEVEE